MLEKDYIHRLVEIKINDLIDILGCIVLTGIKNAGKTKVGKHYCNSFIELKNTNERTIAVQNINYALNGEYPRLIDEWQEIPEVWNDVKTRIDNEGKPGLYILTGSSTIKEETLEKRKISLHSGAGRFAKIKIRNFTLFEMNKSAKLIHFEDFFDKEKVLGAKSILTVQDYADICIKGGWKQTIDMNINKAMLFNSTYIDNVCDVDVRQMKYKPNPKRMRLFMNSIARNIGTQTDVSVFKDEADLKSSKTAHHYLDALEKIFVIERLEPFKTHIRSSVIARVKPKWYFSDPCLASACLRLSPKKLLSDMNAFGFYFENLVIKELKCYAELIDADVSYYRDSTGLEIDAIVEQRSGDWSIFEVKIGGDENLQKGVNNIEFFLKKLPENKKKYLKSCNIITAGPIAKHMFTKDGRVVNIVPLDQIYWKDFTI